MSDIPLTAFTQKPTITAGRFPPIIAATTVPILSRKSGSFNASAIFDGIKLSINARKITANAMKALFLTIDFKVFIDIQPF